MKSFARKISAALLSVILICSFVFVSGCGFLDISVREISFVSGGDKIIATEMSLGSRLDLSKMISVQPALASDKSYTVVSDNSSVVAVTSSGSAGAGRMYAQAVGVGKARLTATTTDGGKTATLDVSVDYALPEGISVEVPDDYTMVQGAVILYSDDLGSELSFRSKLGDNTDPETEIEWSVTGTEQKIRKLAGEEFSFVPDTVGIYEVTASVGDSDDKYFYDTVQVRVVDEISGASVDYTGSLEQDANRTGAVSFVISYDEPSIGNPEPIVEWAVNGNAAAYGLTFEYIPSSPGFHEITASINGKEVDTVTVRVSGTIVPQNVYVDFDNCYPEVWIRWDNIPARVDYKISIIDLTTHREVSTDLTTRNKAIADKFTSSGFDASDYIADIFGTKYSVTVKILGDDELISEGDWAETYTTDLVPARAKSYLASKFYDGARNRYMTSRDEFYEWFEYAMLWRTSSVEAGEKLYLAYDFASASKEIDWAMSAQHFTGSYLYNGTEDRRYGNECTFSIEFQTDGSPSRRTSAPHSGEAWNAMRPHVNYDESKARPSKYEFPIDRLTPVTVETSDQLYYTAQLGYRPVPLSGSSAERLYNYARRTLRYIVTDDMTDVQKIHAIYDWIMWRNIYDYEVLSYTSLSTAVKYEAYYLESIFTDNYHYGVCDAMSKAFVLMCRMEGFECVRVTGTAGSGRDSGGHAWNKVKLYGQWYIVDCTWGDVSVQLFAGGDSREAASHIYFLVSDADVKATHFEDSFLEFPATAKTRYPWYEDIAEYDGKEINTYFEKDLTVTKFSSTVNTFVTEAVEIVRGSEKTYKVGFDEANRTAPQYYAFETVSASRWGMGELSTLRTSLDSAFRKYKFTYGRDYYIVMSDMGSFVHALIFIRQSI